MLVVPTISVVVAGGALLGPARPRPVGYVRLSAASAPARARALRVESLARVEAGIDLGVPLAPGAIAISAGSRVCASGAFGADAEGLGVVALVPVDGGCPEGAPLVARIVRGGSPTEIVPLASEAHPMALDAPRVLHGARSGELAVRVAVPRGSLAAGFAEEIAVEVTRAGAGVAGASVVVHGDGARFAEGADVVELRTDARGRATTTVTALGHVVDVHAEASDRASHGAFDGPLPIVPGAAWIDPAAVSRGELRVVSPVARERAFVGVRCESGDELLDVSTRLSSSTSGRFEGAFAIEPTSAACAHRVAVVAFDVEGAGAGTVAWPLDRPADPFAGVVVGVREARVGDGFARADSVERARAGRVRASVLVVLAAALALEAWLLARAGRAAEAALDRGLDGLGGDELSLRGARGAPFALAAAVFAVAVAFALLALVVIVRAG